MEELSNNSNDQSTAADFQRQGSDLISPQPQHNLQVEPNLQEEEVQIDLQEAHPQQNAILSTQEQKIQFSIFLIFIFQVIFTQSISRYDCVWIISYCFVGNWKIRGQCMQIIHQGMFILLYTWGYLIWLKDEDKAGVATLIFLLFNINNFLNSFCKIFAFACCFFCACSFMSVLFIILREKIFRTAKKRDQYLKKLNQSKYKLPAKDETGTEINDINNEQTECSICLDKSQNESADFSKLLCNHIFHYDCIKLWIQSNKTCPICRHEVY